MRGMRRWKPARLRTGAQKWLHLSTDALLPWCLIETRGGKKRVTYEKKQIVTPANPPWDSTVSVGVGSETVYHHALEWVFDDNSVPLSRTVMFVLDFPLVSCGICGQPLYLTSAANLYNHCSHILCFSFPFSFLAAQIKPIASQSHSCATERESPLCSKPPVLSYFFLTFVIGFSELDVARLQVQPRSPKAANLRAPLGPA